MAVPQYQPMADAERGCRAFVILGGINLIIPVVCRCLNALRTARLPLIQGRHKIPRCVCIVLWVFSCWMWAARPGFSEYPGRSGL